MGNRDSKGISALGLDEDNALTRMILMTKMLKGISALEKDRVLGFSRGCQGYRHQ